MTPQPGTHLHRSVAQQVLIGLVKFYRLMLSPWLGSGCRFEPTCSRYALEALATQGGVRGAGLTAWRLLRCHPWCQGGHDPVPAVSTSTPNRSQP